MMCAADLLRLIGIRYKFDVMFVARHQRYTSRASLFHSTSPPSSPVSNNYVIMKDLSCGKTRLFPEFWCSHNCRSRGQACVGPSAVRRHRRHHAMGPPLPPDEGPGQAHEPPLSPALPLTLTVLPPRSLKICCFVDKHLARRVRRRRVG